MHAVRSLRTLWPQPLIGAVVATAAMSGLGAVWIVDPWYPSGDAAVPTLAVALALWLAIMFTGRFPIHVGPNTKLYMSSTALYLMAVLLPPALAATVAVCSILASEFSVRGQKGSYLSDIATDAGRIGLMVLAASLSAHLAPGAGVGRSLTLILPGIVLWIGDILTLPLLLCPMVGEPPLRIITTVVQEAGFAEGSQYLVGLLGALVARDELWALALIVPPTVLVYRAFKSAKEMHEGTRHILERMADTVDLRDPYTGGHSRRVTELCHGILLEMGNQGGPETELILAAARVHDIGKIGIPDAVLKKPGALTDEERALMETHPDRGAELLKRYPDFTRGVAIVRHHHERWDGKGYPDGLKGIEIPLGARVVAVADSFDAMTSDRPYRSGMSARRAAAILESGRGEQWDAAIVDVFVRSIATRLQAEEPAATVGALASPATVPVAPALSHMAAG